MIKSVAALGEYLSNSRQAVSGDLLAVTETSRSAGGGGGGGWTRGGGGGKSLQLLFVVVAAAFPLLLRGKVTER